MSDGQKTATTDRGGRVVDKGYCLFIGHRTFFFRLALDATRYLVLDAAGLPHEQDLPPSTHEG